MSTRIAYVYAAPLIRRVGLACQPVDVLDIVTEKERLKEVISRSRCGIRWSETVATTETFWRVTFECEDSWVAAPVTRCVRPHARMWLPWSVAHSLAVDGMEPHCVDAAGYSKTVLRAALHGPRHPRG